MTFKQAFSLLDGKFACKIRRKNWEGFIKKERLPLYPDYDSDFYREYTDFYVEFHQGTRQYMPTVEDLQANDWEEVI